MVYLQEESTYSHVMWSARLDGSDKRREVQCPAPEVGPPAVLPPAYWLGPEPFDISPDGTHIVRSCVVRATADANFRDVSPTTCTFVVQDVDGVGYQELWRYDEQNDYPYPSWSPDGSQILVRTKEAIHFVRPDGSGLRTIPAPQGPYEASLRLGHLTASGSSPTALRSWTSPRALGPSR